MAASNCSNLKFFKYMIQTSIDRSCKEQLFGKFLLALTKIPVPTFAFPLELRAKNEWEKNVNLDNFSKLSELTQSVVENGIIFTGAEKLYGKTICTVNVASITFHSLKKSLTEKMIT